MFVQAILMVIGCTASGPTAEAEAVPVAAAAVTPASEDSTLYVAIIARAAPGRLLDLVDAYQALLKEARGDGGKRGYMMRHSQGDQWDLMLVVPVGTGVLYSADEDYEARFGLDELLAWRQELIVVGPPEEEFTRRMDPAGFFHIEMFVALPGKRAELLEERRMENAYLEGVDRPTNFIFRRVGGAEWDAFTLGTYRDLQHFAESGDLDPQLEDRAARAAGFEAANRIGTYLRSLIAYHNDTLAVPAR